MSHNMIITPQAIEMAHNADIARVNLIGSNVVDLAFSLVERKKNGEWDNTNFETFNAYCCAPQQSGGLGMSDSTRRAYMQIPEVYHERLGVSKERLLEIGQKNRSALTMLAPVVNEDNLDDVLADAESLSCGDIKKRKAEGDYGNKPQTSAPPSSYIKCPNCGHEIQG